MAVAAEALFTYGVSRVDVNQLLKTPRSKSLPDLTYRAPRASTCRWPRPAWLRY